MPSLGARDQIVDVPGIGLVDVDVLEACTIDTCPVWWSFYNYYLDQAAYIAFAVLFAVALAIYLTIWIRTKKAHFFNAVMMIGCAVEVIGYAGLIWASTDQWQEVTFLIQIICLTLAPAFFSAGVYVCLGHIVIIYGRDMSWLKPVWYTYIFVPGDLLALLLQGIGGALAASALTTYSFQDYQNGVDILTTGLVWQVFTLLCFVSLCIAYGIRVMLRWRKAGNGSLNQEEWALRIRKTWRFKLFLPALTLSTILILWRCIFRVVELNDGFYGPVTFDQAIFIGFEGSMISTTVFVMALAHPAICLGEAVSDPELSGANFILLLRKVCRRS